MNTSPMTVSNKDNVFKEVYVIQAKPFAIYKMIFKSKDPLKITSKVRLNNIKKVIRGTQRLFFFKCV